MSLAPATAALATGPLPAQPFFSSPEQRVSLARERFFESGERPTGLVSEAVIQSWARLRSARRNPRGEVSFEPVSRSRAHAALERSRGLLLAAGSEIVRLERALAGTACRVLLTDGEGVIVHATASNQSHLEPVMQRAARCGVNLAEHVVGTNAPAVVVKSGQAVTVLGAEHYFHTVHSLRCAAAPIRDGQGRLAGVLDLTVEARPFAFDAAALVGVYATVIENRLLEAGADDHVVLAFQVCQTMIGSPLQALVGVAGDGRLAFCNQTAQRLLGLAGGALPDAETVLGLPLSALLALTRERDASLVRLPNGLAVWLQAQHKARDGLGATIPLVRVAPADVPVNGSNGSPAPLAMPAANTTLSALTREAIDRTVAECGGNLSAAARRLGCSRGLLYRRRAAA